MSHRLVDCRACRTAFLVDDDPVILRVACPKCGVGVDLPSTAASVAVGPAGGSVFVAAAGGRRRSRRALGLVLLCLSAVAVVAIAVVLLRPGLRSLSRATPADPVEAVATAYLRVLVSDNADAVAKLGAVDLPPAIRSFRDVRHARGSDTLLKGSFAPIAALHARIDERFAFDPGSGRYTPRDTLGPAAEVLDALHEAKAKAETSGLYAKMQSGNPDDIFDAAEGLGKTFTDLASGVLSPRALVPTYKMLLDDAKPPLPAAERSLAMDYAEHRTTWDALLGRPFASIRADGPFILERAEVTAATVDALGSAGDPPTTLRLTLTRFRLEGIDTGWRVTGARRLGTVAEEATAGGSLSRMSPGVGVGVSGRATPRP